MHEDRIKIATALGYYARAAGEIQALADAIAAYAPDEYRYDIDCQIAFRKGFQEAGERPEAHELRELVGWIAKLEQQVHEQRRDILEYLKRQEALTHPLVYGGGAPGGGGGGGDGGVAPIEAIKTKVKVTPDDTISIGVGSPGGEWKRPLGTMDQRFFMRRMDTGQLFCQDGKPVSYADLEDCWMACRDLAERMGILCEPAELGKLNLNIGINQRQNSPRVDVNQRARELRRRIAKLPE
jgi:hypothetical protein